MRESARTVSLAELLSASSELVLDWARAALPFYGEKGSMDVDLAAIPDAAGPSYYNQFAHWPLLMLSEGLLAGASDEERMRFRRAALSNIEYAIGMADAEFHTPHYSLGKDWGRHVGEWLNYYLMKSLLLARERGVGSPELLLRLERNVRGAAASIYRSFLDAHGPDAPPATRFPGNHAAWHGLLVLEAGLRFGEPEWVDFGKYFFRTRVLQFQLPSGCWPEGGGIVVNYSMVTALALSIYAELTGEREARAALGRFFSFVRFFSFPDASAAVAADCRQRYYPYPMAFFPTLFLSSASGRADGLERIRRFHEHFRRVGVKALGVQGLAFFANVADFIRRESLKPDGEHAGGREAARLEPLPVSGIEVARLESGPWTAFLSWQLVEETPSRWILDAQNYVEVHHEGSGYLVGGGNSKYAPRFSTIRRRNAGRAYVPDQATALEQSPRRAEVAYGFGGDRVTVALELDSGGVDAIFRIVSRAVPGSTYEAALMLYVRPDERIRINGAERVIDPKGLIEEPFPEGGLIELRGRALRVPTGALLLYPMLAHNPYRQDGLPAPESYAARLCVEVGEAPVRFRLE